MAVAPPQDRVLSNDILARCAERAPIYDRENRFFTEDFEELRQAGYLCMNVPEELGGMGMSLAQVCQEQTAAPGTIQLTEQTYKLIAGYFDCDDMGLVSVKGLAGKVRAYRVRGERGSLARIDVARERGFTRPSGAGA
jgi:hypothetical protein